MDQDKLNEIKEELAEAITTLDKEKQQTVLLSIQTKIKKYPNTENIQDIFIKILDEAQITLNNEPTVEDAAQNATEFSLEDLKDAFIEYAGDHGLTF